MQQPHRQADNNPGRQRREAADQAAAKMGSNNQEEFLLKWNDHHNSFFVIMEELCASELLTDVTLACGGQIFETHKIMLCACSNFFRQILTKPRPDRHPIVFLKDVDPKHLEQLLQYMYQGEINVLQDDLPPLIETARALQVNKRSAHFCL